MQAESIALSAASLVVTLVFTVGYFAKVAEAKLTRSVASHALQFLLGLLMGIASMVWAWRDGTL